VGNERRRNAAAELAVMARGGANIAATSVRNRARRACKRGLSAEHYLAADFDDARGLVGGRWRAAVGEPYGAIPRPAAHKGARTGTKGAGEW